MNETAFRIRSVDPHTDDSVPSTAKTQRALSIKIGKDILELLSTSMYVDPMTIYREYAQNAADSIDDAFATGALKPKQVGNMEISIDAGARHIRIRDNGLGISRDIFAEKMCSLGASSKRGTQSRGFRGVGRLAGLGYCQELVFRSHANGEDTCSELRWDCRRLKAALRSDISDFDLVSLVSDVVTLQTLTAEPRSNAFFEVELVGVVRHRNDRLLNPEAVGEYLSQVAPVPFSPEFRHGAEITDALSEHVKLGMLDIRINKSEQPVYRPHRDIIGLGNGKHDRVSGRDIKQLLGMEGEVAAIAWVVHHSYFGALPNKSLCKGLRFRVGNVQVGDNIILQDLFPEERFNAWAIGEVHVIDKRILPNGRRDNFEQNVHFDNLLNQLAPIAREIAKHCRDSSIGRKWINEFRASKETSLERAKAIARGGISKSTRQMYSDQITAALTSMRKISITRHIGEDTRTQLEHECIDCESKIKKLLKAEAAAKDPLLRFPPQARGAYQQVISLIYECTGSSAVASALVEKIIERIVLQSSTAGHNREKKRKLNARRKTAKRGLRK